MTSRSHFDRKLAAYALAAGSALATSEAQAAVIYSGPLNTLYDSAGPDVSLDFNNDGQEDFVLTQITEPQNFRLFMANSSGNVVCCGIPASTLAPGTMVDTPLLSSAAGWGEILGYKMIGFDPKLGPTYGVTGNWANDLLSPSYAGFRFWANGNTEYYYGWILLSGVVDSPNHGALEVWGWAYESNMGQGIAVGDVGAPAEAPEPSTLGLLALGAAGVAALRKRQVV